MQSRLSTANDDNTNLIGTYRNFLGLLGMTVHWPFPTVDWDDPPWILRGSMVTIWYSVDVRDLVDDVHPELLPDTPHTEVRARLYEITATTKSGIVPFNEAVLACRTNWKGHEGELSYAMWTDSDVYLQWGREAFGWPLHPAAIDIGAIFWQVGGRLQIPGVDFDLKFDPEAHVEELPYAPPQAPWITPRRRVLPGGAGSIEELLLISPRILDPGSTRPCIASFGTARRWPSAEYLGAHLTNDFVLEVGSEEQIQSFRR